MFDKSKAPPPPTKGLKGGQPRKACAYVKMCACMCVRVCVCARTYDYTCTKCDGFYVSMCHGTPTLPALVYFTCQMCVYVFFCSSGVLANRSSDVLAPF